MSAALGEPLTAVAVRGSGRSACGLRLDPSDAVLVLVSGLSRSTNASCSVGTTVPECAGFDLPQVGTGWRAGRHLASSRKEQLAGSC